MTTLSAAACRENPAPPAPPASVPASLPATAPLSSTVEVLIVTQPEDAQILAEGQVLGKTPMKIKIREDTNLVLKKEGFVRQAILLTTKSDPNLVVKLLPAAEEPSLAALNERRSNRRGSRKAKPSGSGDDSKAYNTDMTKNQSETTKPPAARTRSQNNSLSERAAQETTASPKKTTRAKLDTMRKCKEAYNNGLITRADYQSATEKIRGRLRKEIDDLKTRYRGGEITKAQYRQQARDIKLRYEG